MSPREGWLELVGCVVYVHGYLVVHGPPWPQVQQDDRRRLYLEYDERRSLMPAVEFLCDNTLVDVVLEHHGVQNRARGMLTAVSSDGSGTGSIELWTELGKWSQIT